MVTDKINDALFAFECAADGKISNPSPQAAIFFKQNRISNIFTLSGRANKKTVSASLDKVQNSCIFLGVVKNSYLTLEYKSQEACYFCALFCLSCDTRLDSADELLKTGIELEYVSSLGDNSDFKVLYDALFQKQQKLFEYNKLSMQAKSLTLHSPTNITRFIDCLCDYINSMGQSFTLDFKYNPFGAFHADIDNTVFAKLFCAAVSCAYNKTCCESIDVEILQANKATARIMLSCSVQSLAKPTAHSNFLMQLCSFQNIDFDEAFDASKNTYEITLEISATHTSDSPLQSPAKDAKITDFLDVSALDCLRYLIY